MILMEDRLAVEPVKDTLNYGAVGKVCYIGFITGSTSSAKLIKLDDVIVYENCHKLIVEYEGKTLHIIPAYNVVAIL